MAVRHFWKYGGKRRPLIAMPVSMALICSLAAAVGWPSEARAAALPANFQQRTVLSGLTMPTNVEFSPDGRVFVAEKSGLIKVFDSLTDTTASVLADLRPQTFNGWDRGLLGLALHPDFPKDPRVYVAYTYNGAMGGTYPRWPSSDGSNDQCPDPPGSNNAGCVVAGRISVFTQPVQAAGALRTENTAQAAPTEQVLLEDYCQQFPSHSIGTLAFGADGMLYAGGGDGARCPRLRLAVPRGQWTQRGVRRGQPEHLRELYAAGASAITAPYYNYRHSDLIVPGEKCNKGSSSISGMAFYAASTYPAQYRKGLFFTDYARDCVWMMKAGTNGLPDKSKIETFTTDAGALVDLQAGPGGDIFAVDITAGRIVRYTYNAVNNPPVALIKSDVTSGPLPLTVAFDGSASNDADANVPLSYAWDLDGDGAYDDSTAARPSHTYTAKGSYTVGLQVTDTRGATDSTTAVITAGSTPPVATIETPGSDTTWKVGDTIAFRGKATDGEDGELTGPALKWQVIMHHCPSNCHTHTLGVRPVGAVLLRWEAAYAKSYRIEVSADGKTWTSAYAQTKGNGKLDFISFAPRNARYVRMNGLKRATRYGYSLWEFEIFDR